MKKQTGITILTVMTTLLLITIVDYYSDIDTLVQDEIIKVNFGYNPKMGIMEIL